MINKSNIVLIDATDASLTVSWPEVPGAERYILQYKRTGDGDGDGGYETLSEDLKSTQARKRNLSGDAGFVFRARAAGPGPKGSWIMHPESFALLSADAQSGRMRPPSVVADGSQAAIVRWKPPEAGAGRSGGYELQMRENDGGRDWTTVAARLGGTEVRKKNLASARGYQFRVRPVPATGASSDGTAMPFSSPSEVVVGRVLSDGLGRWFEDLEEGKLLRGSGGVTLADALAGKEFVLLYASAHWCGPCRQFTPQLAGYYNSTKSQPGGGEALEVVFLSADRDEGSFRSYFSSMPWLAVPYGSDAREGIMDRIRVTGILRLCVLDGRTGRVLEDNAVGQPLDAGRWRRLAGR